MQKISTCLWFDSEAEKAARFYCSVFGNSKITEITHYMKEGHEVHGRPEGSVMTVSYELEGVSFMNLNGGPHFRFTPAISLLVNIDTQEELDHLWEQLSAHPDDEQCGWCKDKYGLSWQLVPKRLQELFATGDAAQRARLMRAMLEMKRFDIAALERALIGN